jgi:CYTH domain-containing protein
MTTDHTHDEIEYAFFLPKPPADLAQYPSTRIEQDYFDMNVVSIYLTTVARTREPIIIVVNTNTHLMVKLALTKNKFTQFSRAMLMIHDEEEDAEMYIVPNEPLSYCARLRCEKQGDKATWEFTIKGPGAEPHVRAEANLILSSTQITDILPTLRMLTDDQSIVKDRYRIPVKGSNKLIWEMDVFSAPFYLVKAECEVQHPDVPAPTAPGHWCAVNVTGQRQFDNASLAKAATAPMPDVP